MSFTGTTSLPIKNETIVVLFAKMCVVQDFSKGHTRLELKKRVVRLKLILSKLLDSFGYIWSIWVNICTSAALIYI